MTARLEPPAKLSMVEEEHPVAPRRDHDRAPREMSLGDTAVERVGMTVHEGENLDQVRRFLGVRGHVTSELAVELTIARGAGHAFGSGVSRRHLI
jgi:hypothetical protein